MKSRSKSSRSLHLTLMASSCLALGACVDETADRTPVAPYQSLEACQQADLYTDEECEAEFKKAKELHEKSAPRYESASLCSSEFGASCEYRQRADGTGFWSPFFTGYMVARILDGGDSRRHYYSTPYYTDIRGNQRTWDGNDVRMSRSSEGNLRPTISKETVAAKPQPAKVMTRTSVISKGGFGSRSTSRSSMSSSRGG